MERLQRYLSRAGVASRRAAEELIRAGAVSVNGQVVKVLGTKVDPDRDRIAVNGCQVSPLAETTCLMLHKPAGYVTTMRDPQGRPRVMDLLPREGPRVFPVGRLDLDTTGLLLLTNDGGLAQHLLHPSHGVWKVYHARVEGVPGAGILGRLRRGVRLEDGLTAPARVKILAVQDGYATLEVGLHEGRKRQLRRMLAAVGHPVRALARVGFGPLHLGSLASGSWRPLTPAEIVALRNATAGRGSDGRQGES